MNELITTIVNFIRSDTLDKIIWLCGVAASEGLAFLRELIDSVVN